MSSTNQAQEIINQFKAIVCEELLPNAGGIAIQDFQRINETLIAADVFLAAKEEQHTNENELRRKLTESEERSAHSNAMLRRATRLLDEVVYSKQQSSELIEEVEQLRQISAGGDL